MKELSPVTPFKGPNDEGGATPGHADEFNQRQKQLMIRDEEIRDILSSQAQQTAELKHGQNIVEADQSSVADVMIEGRTMVNLLGDGKIKPSTDGQQTSETFTRREGIASAGVAQVRENGKYGKYSQWLRADTPIFSITKMYSKNDFLRRFPVGSKLAIRIDARGSSSRTLSFGGVGYFRTDSFATKSIWNQSNEYEPIVLLVTVPDEDYKNYHISIEPRHSGAEMEVDGFAIYSITDDEYIKGLSMTNKQLGIQYPYIDDVQHVLNPVITKKGVNLLAPFADNFTTRLPASDIIVEKPYEIEFEADGSDQFARFHVPVLENTTYHLQCEIETNGSSSGVIAYNKVDTGTGASSYVHTGAQRGTFTTPLGTKYIEVRLSSLGAKGNYKFKNFMLSLGQGNKSFQPHNDDFLYAQAILRSSLDGTVRDIMYRKGNDYVYHQCFKQLKLDGSTLKFKANRFDSNEGFVEIYTDEIKDNKPFSQNGKHFLMDSKFYLYPQKSNTGEENILKSFVLGGAGLWIRIPNIESGWTNTPSDTQIVEYLKANPFQLQYELANPADSILAIEGSVGLHSGQNLIEVDSGVIVREKVIPKYIKSVDEYHINSRFTGAGESTFLKMPALKINKIYADGKDVTQKFNLVNDAANGRQRAWSKINRGYDPDAEYTVTYTVLDKHQFTTNVDKASVAYQTSLKSTHDASVKHIVANTSAITAINLMMGELVKSIRILGGE